MLIRSIYGETPEGTVPVEDRAQQREIRKAFRQAKQVGVGPQQIGLRKESHRTKQVRVAETAS